MPPFRFKTPPNYRRPNEIAAGGPDFNWIQIHRRKKKSKSKSRSKSRSRSRSHSGGSRGTKYMKVEKS